MFSSISNKSIRIAFTNFKDVPKKYFLYPLEKLLLDTRSFKIVNYYNPHVQFFSVFGSLKTIKISSAKCKIFFSGENVNYFRKGEYKGNCTEFTSLSFGFDYSNETNYYRFPLWLMYYFTPLNTKEEIKKLLNNFNQKI